MVKLIKMMKMSMKDEQRKGAFDFLKSLIAYLLINLMFFDI